jgi:predicted small secreted protein
MVRTITLAALIASTLAISACNTVRGIGRDVESIGKTVEKTAD